MNFTNNKQLSVALLLTILSSALGAMEQKSLARRIHEEKMERENGFMNDGGYGAVGVSLADVIDDSITSQPYGELEAVKSEAERTSAFLNDGAYGQVDAPSSGNIDDIVSSQNYEELEKTQLQKKMEKLHRIAMQAGTGIKGLGFLNPSDQLLAGLAAGNFDLVKYAVEHGADVNLRSHFAKIENTNRAFDLVLGPLLDGFLSGKGELKRTAKIFCYLKAHGLSRSDTSVLLRTVMADAIDRQCPGSLMVDIVNCLLEMGVDPFCADASVFGLDDRIKRFREEIMGLRLQVADEQEQNLPRNEYLHDRLERLEKVEKLVSVVEHAVGLQKESSASDFAQKYLTPGEPATLDNNFEPLQKADASLRHTLVILLARGKCDALLELIGWDKKRCMEGLAALDEYITAEPGTNLWYLQLCHYAITQGQIDLFTTIAIQLPTVRDILLELVTDSPDLAKRIVCSKKNYGIYKSGGDKLGFILGKLKSAWDKADDDIVKEPFTNFMAKFQLVSGIKVPDENIPADEKKSKDEQQNIPAEVAGKIMGFVGLS